MTVKILDKEQARSEMKVGIKALADAAKMTIGPRGRNVAIRDQFGNVEITNDGKKIGDSISMEDSFQDMGATIAKKVANKTNDMAGDGRSTSLLLLDSIVSEGMKHISVGVSANAIRSGIEKAMNEGIEMIKEMSIDVTDVKQIRKVATISAESEEIGNIIGDLVDKVGKDALITTEESNSIGITSEVVEGIEIDKGYISHYMMTDQKKMVAEYVGSKILITDKKITSFKEILPILTKLMNEKIKALVIIAEDIDIDPLAGIIANRLKGEFMVLGIKAPSFGERKKDILADIAVMVGATVVSDDTGLKLEDVNIENLGHARTVTSSKDKTTIVGGDGKREDIDKRIELLKLQRDNQENKYQTELLEERIAKLSGGCGVIHVGAVSETEMGYLTAKISDAVSSAKAAVEEGMLPGGGATFMRVAEKLKAKIKDMPMSEEKIGYEILISALYRPLVQIVLNGGEEDASLVIEKIRNGGDDCGYDANKKEVVEDMFDAGIIDATKVVRLSLLHSASEAAIFLTTDKAISEVPDKKE